MSQAQEWMERMADKLDLSGEPIPERAIVELYGTNRVLIEHHRGITQYSRESICVTVSYGTLRIRGSELELSKMSRQQLIIRGHIMSVSLERR